MKANNQQPAAPREQKRQAYNKLNREMGGTLGPFAPPRPAETTQGEGPLLCRLCKAQECVHPLPGCQTFIDPRDNALTADFFLQHETKYTQHKEWWVWECACGAIEEEKFVSWEECHVQTRRHWAAEINKVMLQIAEQIIEIDEDGKVHGDITGLRAADASKERGHE